MKKVSQSASLAVTATSMLDAQLVHAYLSSQYKNQENILVIPTTNPHSFEEFYLGTYSEITQDQRDILTDMIIPFHMAPSQHFTLLHIKFIGHEKQPVIYWLDSMGAPMPLSVSNTVNAVFQHPNKIVHAKAIAQQQDNDYDCGVYVAQNAQNLVNTTNQVDILTNNLQCNTLSAAESVALRQQMVAVANEDLENKYVYIQSPSASSIDTTQHNSEKPDSAPSEYEKFIDDLSQDLLDFGASVQDDTEAFTKFDTAFNLAQVAHKNATERYKTNNNRHAFFSEYQSFKHKLAQHSVPTKEETSPSDKMDSAAQAMQPTICG